MSKHVNLNALPPTFLSRISRLCDDIAGTLQGGFNQDLWRIYPEDYEPEYPVPDFDPQKVRKIIKSAKDTKSLVHRKKKTGLTQEDIGIIGGFLGDAASVMQETYDLELWDNGYSFNISDALNVKDEARELASSIEMEILKARMQEFNNDH